MTATSDHNAVGDAGSAGSDDSCGRVATCAFCVERTDALHPKRWSRVCAVTVTTGDTMRNYRES
jgi:hypothetical protein